MLTTNVFIDQVITLCINKLTCNFYPSYCMIMATIFRLNLQQILKENNGKPGKHFLMDCFDIFLAFHIVYIVG